MPTAAEADVKLSDFASLFTLNGKVAVVTGGSRGLGLHAASGLLQGGCAKVYITSRKKKACDEAVAALNALPNKPHGSIAISVPADGSKVSEIERLVTEVSKTTAHVDILLANAGATWGAPLEQHTEANMERVIGLNVNSVFFCVQKFLPLLTARATAAEPSRVIATASVAGLSIGHTGANSTVSYSASKAAVIHLMRHLAIDLSGRFVLCNSIAPGFFPSRMSSGLVEKMGGFDHIARSYPNRRVGRPEDFAGAVLFLASRAGSHANGAIITLDGGKMWDNTSNDEETPEKPKL